LERILMGEIDDVETMALNALHPASRSRRTG